jgi:hypothetical protein
MLPRFAGRRNRRSAASIASQPPPVPLRANQPHPKLPQHPLREERLDGLQTIQHQLPAPIHHAQLYGLSIRHAQIGLQQRDHGQQRGRHGRLACPRVPRHRLQLGLEGVVEQLVPLRPQKGKQFPGAPQAAIAYSSCLVEVCRGFHRAITMSCLPSSGQGCV